VTDSHWQWWKVGGSRAAIAAIASFGLASLLVHPANAADEIQGVPWVGAMGIVETTAEISARQAARDRLGIVEPQFTPPHNALDHLLIDDSAAAPRARFAAPLPPPASAAPLSVGLNFKSDQYGNLVPPDTQMAAGPTQILSVSNRGLQTFNKTTGVADGFLNVTTNTFFASVNAGQSTFDVQARYDRLSQRYIITAEDGTTPNKIFIAVSNTPSITSATAWTFYFFNISLVTPAGDGTCFADYPATGVDANALIIGVNNFCPNAYGGSAVFVVRKSSILSGGPIVVTVFRNVGQVTPRGIDSWDPDPSGTASSYFISVFSTGSLRLRRITSPGGTPVLSAGLDVAIPTVATPIDLEHLGNALPGGAANGKIDGNDTRFMPSMSRNGTLWATHGTSVNSSGVASGGDRDAARWYQINNLDATPTLVQSGTIFDSAVSNPRSYTFPTMAVSSQGHAVFGFSVIGATQFNAAGYTSRLAGDPAGFANAPVAYANGVGAYNAFDKGTSTGQRWGDYSRTTLDPCDDMTIWTAQEYTAQANTVGSFDAQWGIRVAQVRAPPPASLVSVNPPSVAAGQASVVVTVNGTSAGGSGFYDTQATNNDACRKRIAAAIPGVIVNSVTYLSPLVLSLNVSTVGATAGTKNVTVTNPDGQAATGTGIFTITGGNTPPALQNAKSRKTHGGAGTFDLPLAP
jgi:hypothetical protein